MAKCGPDAAAWVHRYCATHGHGPLWSELGSWNVDYDQSRSASCTVRVGSPPALRPGRCAPGRAPPRHASPRPSEPGPSLDSTVSINAGFLGAALTKPSDKL